MAAIPKPASTVVLLDEMDRVYMTKRPTTMKFLGGYFVFPGGAVEKDDQMVDHDFIRNQHHVELLHSSFYVAAARELYEEIGILLCDMSDGSQPHIPRERELEYRRQLINGELSFLQLLKKENMYLNISRLTYFGNFVTPERSPIRFDTHFFLSYLPQWQQPDPDTHEIEEGLWITPEEALSANKNHRMPMVLPTITTLKIIKNYFKRFKV